MLPVVPLVHGHGKVELRDEEGVVETVQEPSEEVALRRDESEKREREEEKETHGRLVSSVPAPSVARLLPPMRRSQLRLLPHPIRNSLDNSSRNRSLPVVLKRMDELMHQHTLRLMLEVCNVPSASGEDAVEVRRREVELFVLVVEC
jgi:hypothetical protein